MLPDPGAAGRRRRWRALNAHRAEATALVAVSAIGIGAVLWGALCARPRLQVFYYDAGAVDRFAVGAITAYPQHDFYIMGLADGRLRALDGRSPISECSVRWAPDDARGAARNPLGRPGVFLDPCGSGMWAMTGDGLAGTAKPLRTFAVSYERDATGAQHAWVEVLGRPTPTPSSTASPPPAR